MKIYPRGIAPSPESPKAHRIFRSGLSHTPSPPRLSPSLKDLKKWRSVRIPDFVQLFTEIRVNEDGSLDHPLVTRSGILLLVEIKKAKHNCNIYEILPVLDQTDEQARHAFASYPRVNIFGVHQEIGGSPIWQYDVHEPVTTL
jgi:hypothetical protein